MEYTGLLTVVDSRCKVNAPTRIPAIPDIFDPNQKVSAEEGVVRCGRVSVIVVRAIVAPLSWSHLSIFPYHDLQSSPVSEMDTRGTVILLQRPE